MKTLGTILGLSIMSFAAHAQYKQYNIIDQGYQYDLPDQDIPQPKPDRDVQFNPADLQNPEDWKRKYFDVVVVVNKAADAQTLDMYRFGNLVLSTRVSTGREIPEIANSRKREAPKHSYFSRTATGYFTAQYLDIDHVSKTWQDAYMPWAVFFNDGIATHRSPHEDLSKKIIDHNIGRRASGGCVRLHEGDARTVFWTVRAAGGPFSAEELQNPTFYNESQIFSQQGLAPYPQPQEVPNVDPDGALAPANPNTGKIPTHHGARALYVVINVPTGRGVQPAVGVVARRKRPMNIHAQQQQQSQGYVPEAGPRGSSNPVTNFFDSIFQPSH